MSIQVWNILGEISGNFSLTYDEILSSLTLPLHPAVKKFVIYPETNFNNDHTGQYMIELTFEVGTAEDSPPVNTIADIGRDIFNRHIAVLSFLSGYPVRILKPPRLIYNDGGIKKIRRITFPPSKTIRITHSTFKKINFYD
jgi:hypothetical protein